MPINTKPARASLPSNWKNNCRTCIRPSPWLTVIALGVVVISWFILTKTVLGRFLLAAPLAIGRLARHEYRRLPQVWPMWLAHSAVTVLMLGFIAHYSALSVWHYLLLVTAPALSLASIRSYYEHRPHLQPEQRTVLNEASWPWAWLFLNNNLHLVHHDLPKLPWYLLPRVYRARREQWLARSGGFLVQGYGQLISRHGLKAIEDLPGEHHHRVDVGTRGRHRQRVRQVGAAVAVMPRAEDHRAGDHHRHRPVLPVGQPGRHLFDGVRACGHDDAAGPVGNQFASPGNETFQQVEVDLGTTDQCEALGAGKARHGLGQLDRPGHRHRALRGLVHGDGAAQADQVCPVHELLSVTNDPAMMFW